MRFLRVGSSSAIVLAVAVLAGCGGGGGGGGSTGGPVPIPSTPTPTIAPTQAPAAGGYVTPSGGVTQLGPASTFSSSLLGASTDGTLVVQSAESPAEPPASSATLTEYDVTVTESAAGQKPSSLRRASSAGARPESLALYRPRMDVRESALRAAAKRTVAGFGPRIALNGTPALRRPSSFSQGASRVFHVQQGAITGVNGSCTPPQQSVGGDCYLAVTATLQYVSAHGYVWVDNSIDASYGFSAADYQATGAAMDNDYAIETDVFGPAFFSTNNGYTQCDSSGNPLPQSSYQPRVDLSGSDPHISILVTRALEGTGEGGYFDSTNLVNDQELNCPTHGVHVPSNDLPLIVLEADKFPATSGTVT